MLKHPEGLTHLDFSHVLLPRQPQACPLGVAISKT
jgi:hypothetical protein